MRKDFVSVIIPAYNAAPYIGATIQSVLNQTYPHFEIIVVDDASEDDTSGVVNSFADKRVRLIRQQENRGPGEARNTAISAAVGQWMALLDADDQWVPDRLEKLMHAASEAGEGYFVTDDCMLCFDTPEGLQPWTSEFEFQHNIEFTGKYIDVHLEEYLQLGAPGIKPIIPLQHLREHSIQYEPDCLFGEDLEFYCHLFRTGLTLRLYNEPLYLYRRTPGSLTGRANRSASLVGVYDRLLSKEGFSEKACYLLRKRRENVLREQRYAPFPAALKQKRWGQVLLLSLSDPWLVVQFLVRIPLSLRYRFAEKKFEGRAR